MIANNESILKWAGWDTFLSHTYQSCVGSLKSFDSAQQQHKPWITPLFVMCVSEVEHDIFKSIWVDCVEELTYQHGPWFIYRWGCWRLWRCLGDGHGDAFVWIKIEHDGYKPLTMKPLQFWMAKSIMTMFAHWFYCWHLQVNGFLCYLKTRPLPISSREVSIMKIQTRMPICYYLCGKIALITKPCLNARMLCWNTRYISNWIGDCQLFIWYRQYFPELLVQLVALLRPTDEHCSPIHQEYTVRVD